MVTTSRQMIMAHGLNPHATKRSWLSWNKDQCHRTIIHPSGGLAEVIINERELEKAEASFVTRISGFLSSTVGRASILFPQTHAEQYVLSSNVIKSKNY